MMESCHPFAMSSSRRRSFIFPHYYTEKLKQFDFLLYAVAQTQQRPWRPGFRNDMPSPTVAVFGSPFLFCVENVKGIVVRSAFVSRVAGLGNGCD